MKKSVSTVLLLLSLVSCFVLGSVPLPAYGYNSGADGGHRWITNKAIEYLKVIDPAAYMLANRYREQLEEGATRYADHKPTVSLGVTSVVVCTYGCGNGRIGPTRCAVIGGGRGDRYSQC
jgi:hypothetical protein